MASSNQSWVSEYQARTHRFVIGPGIKEPTSIEMRLCENYEVEVLETFHNYHTLWYESFHHLYDNIIIDYYFVHHEK
jgi:hypothetical protein